MLASIHAVSIGSTDVEKRSMSTCKSMRRHIEEFKVTGLPGDDLGQGSSGQVKRVREVSTGLIYAMKIIRKVSKTETFVKAIIREVKIQRELNHPHIVRLQYFCEDMENVYLVLDWAENGIIWFKRRFFSKLFKIDQ